MLKEDDTSQDQSRRFVQPDRVLHGKVFWQKKKKNGSNCIGLIVFFPFVSWAFLLKLSKQLKKNCLKQRKKTQDCFKYKRLQIDKMKN